MSLEEDLGLPDPDPRPRHQQRLHHPDAVDGGAVRRTEIAQDVATVAHGDLAVVPADGVVGELQVAVVRRTDPNRRRGDVAALVGVGPRHDREDLTVHRDPRPVLRAADQVAGHTAGGEIVPGHRGETIRRRYR